jgi:hypothetical protein
LVTLLVLMLLKTAANLTVMMAPIVPMAGMVPVMMPMSATVT